MAAFINFQIYNCPRSLITRNLDKKALYLHVNSINILYYINKDLPFLYGLYWLQKSSAVDNSLFCVLVRLEQPYLVNKSGKHLLWWNQSSKSQPDSHGWLYLWIAHQIIHAPLGPTLSRSSFTAILLQWVQHLKRDKSE
jgi:hypothetical protein